MSNEILEILKQVSDKLDTLIARIEAIEDKILEKEIPEPEDIKAYREMEEELKRSELIPFKKE